MFLFTGGWGCQEPLPSVGLLDTASLPSCCFARLHGGIESEAALCKKSQYKEFREGELIFNAAANSHLAGTPWLQVVAKQKNMHLSGKR